MGLGMSDMGFGWDGWVGERWKLTKNGLVEFIPVCHPSVGPWMRSAASGHATKHWNKFLGISAALLFTGQSDDIQVRFIHCVAAVRSICEAKWLRRLQREPSKGGRRKRSVSLFST
jgi:hypothetical protein